MARNFQEAMILGAQIADRFMPFLSRQFPSATPIDAVMGFAALARKFDEVLRFDPGNPRACRDMLIVLLGGVPPGQAMAKIATPAPEDPKPN